MSLYRELDSTSDVKQVRGVQFCVMSPDEIIRKSVVEVTSTAMTDTTVGGLFDPRMGAMDSRQICPTCEQNHVFCPGHFGHIRLAKPVFHVHFLDTVKRLCKCICLRCSALLVTDDTDPEFKAISARAMSRQKRFELVAKRCARVKSCPRCGMRRPVSIRMLDAFRKVHVEWDASVMADATTEGDVKSMWIKQEYSAEDIHVVLSRVSNSDALRMGFTPHLNRPEWLICTVFPVPPPSVRPSVRNETGQRCEDDLTIKLVDIMKANAALRDKLQSANDRVIDEMVFYLQYHVATFINNSIPQIPQAHIRTGRSLRTLLDRLKGKEGRIRGNLMGKRVDYSARTVITPDPNISIDELGVPIKIAMNLTFPEVVNPYNRTRLVDAVRNGPDVYPGAKHIRVDGRTYRLRSMDRDAIDLKYGDVVERHLVDGDYVLFNRQPSLHRMSMCAHRVRITAFDTFALNVLVTPSYNADFDGDEMNMHVPQSAQTMNELRMLAAVPHQIISPRESEPIVSIVQDVALGVHALTQPGVRIDAGRAANLLARCTGFDGFRPLPNHASMSGRDLLSHILPRGLYVSMGGSSDGAEPVRIENGRVRSGVIDKRVYQAASKGIVHTTYNEMGAGHAQRVFDDTQKLICDWLVYHGFSVGISDLVVRPTATARMAEELERFRAQVDTSVRDVHAGRFDFKPVGATRAGYFENNVNQMLNAARDTIGKMVKNEVRDDNRMQRMVTAGSKGKSINIVQMVGCLGQQNVDGRRIGYGYSHRTLPHYHKFDDGAESRGFVTNSFMSGLTPQEFFFHAMGGREGLIDTAVRTADTGYMQRKLVKAMEDAKVVADGTVRGSSGQVIQFLYGDDGVDPTQMERQRLPFLDMPSAARAEEFHLTDLDALSPLMTRDAHARTMGEAERGGLRERLAAFHSRVEADRHYVCERVLRGSYETALPCPLPVERLTQAAARAVRRGSKVNMTPGEVLDDLEALVRDLRASPHTAGNGLLAIVLRAFLGPVHVITRYRLTRPAWTELLRTLRDRYRASLAHPGEMVGIVSAQSIGEPATQMTLNTFHMSGVSAASKAVQGVPRLKELCHATSTKFMKTPTMTVYALPEVIHDKRSCIALKNKLETTRLSDVVTQSNITYGAPADDGAWEAFLRFSERTCSDEGQQPQQPRGRGGGADEEGGSSNSRSANRVSLRLSMDRQAMHDAGIRMLDVYHAIVSRCEPNTVQCVFTDDNAPGLYMHIRLFRAGGTTATMASDDAAMGVDPISELKAFESVLLDNVIIKGIPNVNGIGLEELRKRAYEPRSREYATCNKWILYTDGTNLIDVLGHPDVDATRTVSNSIEEINEILGIEATRRALHDEINTTMEQSGTHVGYRHLSLLVDTMTHRGVIHTIDRHSINRNDIGPLAKSSFEESGKMLVQAGAFAERDRMDGISANIMFGQVPACGTGYSTIVLDPEALAARLAARGHTADEAGDAPPGRHASSPMGADRGAGGAGLSTAAEAGDVPRIDFDPFRKELVVRVPVGYPITIVA